MRWLWLLALLPLVALAFYGSTYEQPEEDDAEPKHYSWRLGKNESRETEVIYLDSECSCP